MTGGLADGARGGPAQAESASTGECWAIVLLMTLIESAQSCSVKLLTGDGCLL